MFVGICSSTWCSVSERCVERNGRAACACPTEKNCPADIAPVCGTDKKTYINKCMLEVVSCRNDNPTSLASVGTCGKKRFIRQC